jgi:hypothetical protein
MVGIVVNWSVAFVARHIAPLNSAFHPRAFPPQFLDRRQNSPPGRGPDHVAGLQQRVGSVAKAI